MQNKKKTHQGPFLVGMTCPKCTRVSEHSASRVNKQKMLLCPFCNTFIPPKAPTPSHTSLSLKKSRTA